MHDWDRGFVTVPMLNASGKAQGCEHFNADRT
jgi:hypothetical protein